MQLIKVRIYKTISITTVFVAVVMLLFISACSGNKKQLGDAVTNRDSLPALETHDVTTLISDSGVIRYRITTPLWLVYDKLNPSHWSFEEGVYLENFDENNDVQAEIKSDTAYYYDKQKLWELRGHVEIKNQQGERFNTELLFWNQDTQKVYSDQFIRIEQIDRIITGHGFDSNQQFTVYTIHKPEGIFYVDEDDVLALIPVRYPWQVIAWLPIGGFNWCPTPEYQTAFAKHMYEAYGAEIMSVHGVAINYYLETPLTQKEQVYAAVRDLAVMDADWYQDIVPRYVYGKERLYLWWD